MKRIVKRYPDEFKQKVALEYLETDQGIVDLMKKYGIKGNNCITSWIGKFELNKSPHNGLEVQLEMSKIQDKTGIGKKH